jgi:phage-related protein
MARPLSKGERPLDWVGSSKKDFVGFPEPVKDEMGNALGLAQFGGKHPSAKPWKGKGPGVFELVEDHHGKHLPSGLHGAFQRGCVWTARLSEEVTQGDQNGPGRCRSD